MILQKKRNRRMNNKAHKDNMQCKINWILEAMFANPHCVILPFELSAVLNMSITKHAPPLEVLLHLDIHCL
jgi:hypothetical protein